jgi:hypothetical protein
MTVSQTAGLAELRKLSCGGEFSSCGGDFNWGLGPSWRRDWDDRKQVWRLTYTTPSMGTRMFEEQPSSKYPAPTKKTALSF